MMGTAFISSRMKAIKKNRFLFLIIINIFVQKKCFSLFFVNCVDEFRPNHSRTRKKKRIGKKGKWYLSNTSFYLFYWLQQITRQAFKNICFKRMFSKEISYRP
jgi:hypothetical protein